MDRYERGREERLWEPDGKFEYANRSPPPKPNFISPHSGTKHINGFHEYNDYAGRDTGRERYQRSELEDSDDRHLPYQRSHDFGRQPRRSFHDYDRRERQQGFHGGRENVEDRWHADQNQFRTPGRPQQAAERYNDYPSRNEYMQPSNSRHKGPYPSRDREWDTTNVHRRFGNRHWSPRSDRRGLEGPADRQQFDRFQARERRASLGAVRNNNGDFGAKNGLRGPSKRSIISGHFDEEHAFERGPEHRYHGKHEPPSFFGQGHQQAFWHINRNPPLSVEELRVYYIHVDDRYEPRGSPALQSSEDPEGNRHWGAEFYEENVDGFLQPDDWKRPFSKPCAAPTSRKRQRRGNDVSAPQHDSNTLLAKRSVNYDRENLPSKRTRNGHTDERNPEQTHGALPPPSDPTNRSRHL